MQTRRQFLEVATATLVLVPAVQAACGTGPMSTQPTPTGASCDGVLTTSSVVLAHTHTLCVPSSDLSSPPAGGATYTTSPPQPTHTVTLTQAELQAIEGGMTVTVTSSVAGSHTHDFAIHKV
jgi:hypothetical protein